MSATERGELDDFVFIPLITHVMWHQQIKKHTHCTKDTLTRYTECVILAVRHQLTERNSMTEYSRILDPSRFNHAWRIAFARGRVALREHLGAEARSAGDQDEEARQFRAAKQIRV